MQHIEITDIATATSLPEVLAECLRFVTGSGAPHARIVPAPRQHGVLEWAIVLTSGGAKALQPESYRYIQPRAVDKGRIVAHA